MILLLAINLLNRFRLGPSIGMTANAPSSTGSVICLYHRRG